MVDASEGQVLMGVFHDPNNTNLYISEEAGMNYSLSLEHLISPPEAYWINSYVDNNYYKLLYCILVIQDLMYM